MNKHTNCEEKQGVLPLFITSQHSYHYHTGNTQHGLIYGIQFYLQASDAMIDSKTLHRSDGYS